MQTEIVLGEVFGAPVEFQITTERRGENNHQVVEVVLPHVEYDARSGFFRVFPPPLKARELSERGIRALELAGFLKPKTT